MTNAIPRNKPLLPKLPKPCSVKVIGLGGVGSIVARYGACFLSSTGQDAWLTLIDGDKFEPQNSSRMLFTDFGNKAAVVLNELRPPMKHGRLTMMTREEYVKPRNIKHVIQEKDIVLLCVDNHKTRRLVDKHCQKLKNICLISGGNDGIGEDSSGRKRRGTYGNAQIYVRRKGKDLTHAISAFHPEIKHPKDKMPHELSCTDLLVSTPQILFSNLAVASAMLNTLLLYLSESTHYSELSFEIADGLMRPTVGVIK